MVPTIQLLRCHAMRVALLALGLALFALVAATSPDGLAEGIQDDAKPGLTIAIKPTRVESGTAVIERAGGFEIHFTNQSDKPIRLWDEWCQLGYGTLSFRVVDDSGQTWSMHRREWTSDWRKFPTKTITIPPGGVFSWKVKPSEYGGGWGKHAWIGVPEANTGKPVKLTAIFEIKPTDATNQQGVWTGRIESKPLELLVVDAKLKTPHEYLVAGCPKQAIKMIQADRKWLAETDDYQQTPLHVAALCGLADEVKWLLENGADVNARAYNSFTPLHLAGDPEIVKLLLKHKADANAKNSSDRTALEEAAGTWAHYGTFPNPGAERDELRKIIKLLLDAGAEYDIRSAAYLDDVERVRALILADKNQARDKEAMRQAGTYGRLQIVKLLLERGGDAEDADYGGLTVSYFAIEHADVLKLLFDAGADPKVIIRYEGNGLGPGASTLLQEAAQKGALESAKLLLARGLDVNAKTPSGFTPLHFACTKGHAPMVEWLLQNKADPKARTVEGWTPMIAATHEIRPEQEEDNLRFRAVIRVLERHGVEVDPFAAIACNDIPRVASILKADPKSGEKTDPEGQPALHCAVAMDHREIVKMLLEKGCDPEVRSTHKSYGHETALVDAAFWGRLEIAEMLIKHGAKVNTSDEKGATALHEAARIGQLKVAELLLKHGADVNAKDKKGKTPIDWVGKSSKSLEMTTLLLDHGAVKKP